MIVIFPKELKFLEKYIRNFSECESDSHNVVSIGFTKIPKRYYSILIEYLFDHSSVIINYDNVDYTILEILEIEHQYYNDYDFGLKKGWVDIKLKTT